MDMFLGFARTVPYRIDTVSSGSSFGVHDLTHIYNGWTKGEKTSFIHNFPSPTRDGLKGASERSKPLSQI